jgi:hypothetical protein
MQENTHMLTVYCSLEQKEVGHIEVPEGGAVIDAKFFLANFTPERQEHRIYRGSSYKDGSYAGCPKCEGQLYIEPTKVVHKGEGFDQKGTSHTISREQARENAKAIASKMAGGVSKHIESGQQFEGSKIVLGKTKVTVK